MTSINDDDTGSLPDLDMDFDAMPETNALQAVADSIAHEQHQHQHQPHGRSKERSPSSSGGSGNEKEAGDSSDRGKKRSSPTPLEDLNAPSGKVTKRRAARACVRYV